VHRGDGGETTGRAPGDLPVVAARAVTPPRGAFRYRFVYEKHGRSRFLSHLETLRILQRALRRTGWPIRFSEGFHPHPRLSLGPSLAVGVEGDGEFFDAEFAEAPACDPDGINRFLPAGIAVREIAGPFPRSAGKLPQRVRFRYRLAFDALAMLLRGAGPPGNGAPDADAWRRLGSSLEDAGRLREIADRFLPDPAGAAAELWRRWIDEDRILSDRRGRERRCGRCVLRTAAGDFPPGLAESGGAPGVPKSGFEASGGAPGVEAARAPVLELETSGDTDGIQNPRELLRETFPEALVPLVAVKRLAIIFGTDNSNAGPLDLVRGRA
jgi:hypothetical protein